MSEQNNSLLYFDFHFAVVLTAIYLYCSIITYFGFVFNRYCNIFVVKQHYMSHLNQSSAVIQVNRQ